MDAADDLELRWLHLDPSQAGAGSLPGAPTTERSTPPDAEQLNTHDLSNAVTAIVGAARLLCDRWDELGEPERRELAQMVLRRADDLRRVLEGANGTS